MEEIDLEMGVGGVGWGGWVKSGLLPVDCNTSGSVTALHNLMEPAPSEVTDTQV